MFNPRSSGRSAAHLWLHAVVLLFAFAGPVFTLTAAQAQTPAPPPAPTPQPAVPAAAPVSPDSYPAIPAATPVQQDPAQQNPPAPATPSSTYQNPLDKPIVVAPGPLTPPQVAPASPVPNSALPAMPAYAPEGEIVRHDSLGSAYIPVDSTVYPMALRLYSLGYLDSAFINMRPWTRRSLLHMLQKSTDAIMADNNDEAVDILAKLNAYVASEDTGKAPYGPSFNRGLVYGVDTFYTRFMGIDGQTLRDSYHLGQTIANDYGRPYQPGFNNITGFSTLNEWGRFSLYVRGEYQHSPAGTGYSTVDTGNPLAPGGLAETLSNIDQIPYSGYNLNQATIPAGFIAAQNPFRIQEATLSFHVLGHEISGGKSDAWLGPGFGGAMAWSNNAEDIYSFRINRVEPLHIPLVSRVLGPLRYDFFVGSLKGHTAPNAPWVHSEIASFAPTANFQFAFQRTVIWGGHGHGCLEADGVTTYPCDQPITLHTFFKSFFNFTDTTGAEKYSRDDPGARYSDFSFSYRLPFVRHYLTLYVDSIAHDDVTPVSAPRRAAYRPGIFLSQFPGLHKLDFRVEAASTDTSTLRSLGGQFNYFETIQRQGYTNKGFIMGDWIGREAKGGQAWLTYHLSGNEWIQLEYLDKKTPKDFIPGGTTQGQFMVDVVKRLRKDVELNAWLQVERWKAPIYIQNPNNGANHDTTVAVQLTWFPKLRTPRDAVAP